MQELKVNKRFETREEMDKYVKEICEEYVVMLVNHIPQEIGQEIYGVESILHFGKRG